MELSVKTVVLLALTRPLRSADLASFPLSNWGEPHTSESFVGLSFYEFK